ncbi:gluconate 2-dehydrogenase subunit 3 family protein [Echinicola strongylocentroti]|uniref:Gluconate 2-dehydrogenase subunit 3 family protein n=1 Tax=Echinicola strongylocentroti TaxID=1795355 RepID=A0A2Z4IK20_9BACT|nr:gluconate 2-dehydrogenase subunit 3 family protein [Echinicola strongylocentroti]AWW31030.1 gluconate 2-dehydrogenase subunit 3 family protein [Echinicola strongylocentroti]
MNRREAMKSVGLLFGSALSVSTLAVFQQGCTRSKDAVAGVFSDEDTKMMAEIGDIIIPETPDSPGAKAVGIGAFMVKMLEDCYSQEDREKVSAALGYFEDKKDFSSASLDKQTAAVSELDGQVYGKGSELEEDLSRGYKIIKELTLFGYFSSEAGATQALRYELVPGRYDGCVDLKPGDKAWA